MNNHEHHREKSRFEGMADLLARCRFEPRVETVPLLQANGRVAARDVHSLNTLPNALTSAMDAIAVRYDDFVAGMPDTSGWTRGADYEFCNTGIAVPAGFDTAIAIENVSFDEGRLVLSDAPSFRGEHTIDPGTSMKAGDLLIEAGQKIVPALVGLAAQGGLTELEVIARPRVAFIPSGNELAPAGTELEPGQNVECNSLVLAAKLVDWGAEPIIAEICPDKWDVIKQVIVEQLAVADILVVNAGSSKGTDDLTIEIIEEMGEVLNHEFCHGPGRHSSLSIVQGKPVVGIAGPPIGAEFCFDWYVKPLVDAYYGRAMDWPHTLWAMLTEDVPMRPRAVDVVRRVKLERDDAGYLLATPLPNDMKPVLKMCALADGLLVVDKNSHGFRAGDQVEVELVYPYTLPA